MSQDKKKLSLSSALPTSRKRNRAHVVQSTADSSKNELDSQETSMSTSTSTSYNDNATNNNSAAGASKNYKYNNRRQHKSKQKQQQQQQQQQQQFANRGNRRNSGRGSGRRNHYHRNNNKNTSLHHNNRNQRRDQDSATVVNVCSTGSGATSTSSATISNNSGPQRSVEGWIVIVTGVHEEAREEDIRETFLEYGQINNLRVNLDTLTGFCKGYALIEYSQKSEAQDAINALHGKEFLGKAIRVNWAFVGGGVSADDENDATRPNKIMKGSGSGRGRRR